MPIEIRRDYIFEFAGMPKSGKTTVLDIVAHYLKREGLRLGEYHGGGRYAPIDKTSIASLNMLLAAKAAEYILTTSERERDGNRVFLLDRGVFDRYIFTRMLEDEGRIDAAESRAIRSFLLAPRLTRPTDAVFAFTTSPALSLRREYANKLVEREGRVMNNDRLDRLRRLTREAVTDLREHFAAITEVDTERADGDPVGTARAIVDTLLPLFEDAAA
jgi:thymidylate kinase